MRRYRQATDLRCAADECRTDEECGEGCGCVLESWPMRCGPIEEPEPEVCAADECRTDEDCGEGCGCVLESWPKRCGPVSQP